MDLRRRDIDNLVQIGLTFDSPHQVVDCFEKTVAAFFGAPLAVATDSCTHALELCLRLSDHRASIDLPQHTYMSVPMMLDKLGMHYRLKHIEWSEQYDVVPGQISDAATLWRANSYRPGTMMCVSFQFKKHVPIGRGGMILLDNHESWAKLQKMCRDGRDPNLMQNSDDVHEIGYHYYMTPEDAARGLMLFHHLRDVAPKIWDWRCYRNLVEMQYFKRKQNAQL